MRIPILIATATFSSALLLLSCGPAKPAANAEPGGRNGATQRKPGELTGLPTFDVGEGDLAAAAVALAEPDDLEKFREHTTTAQRQMPAEKFFENVDVLDGMTAERFIAAMHGMHESLGVRCPFCHDPQNFPSDEKQEKKMARQMLYVAQRINAEHFDGETRVTCWTCHQGKEKPDSHPADFAAKMQAVKIPGNVSAPADPKAPGGKVYKNLTWFANVPAGQLLPAMQGISASIGKDCSFCHDMNDFSSDDKPGKRVARAMLQLVHRSNGQIFGTMDDEDAVTCWTCHRGSLHPEIKAGVTELPGHEHHGHHAGNEEHENEHETAPATTPAATPSPEPSPAK